MKKPIIILFIQFAFLGSMFSQVATVVSGSAEAEQSTHILLKTVPDFKESNRIKLQWELPALETDNYFRVERSRTGKDFEVMAVIKGKIGESNFEFTDERPGTSNNFYRVKTSLGDGNDVYSEVVATGVSPVKFCSYYPNPVERFLIMRTESRVEITISDGQGNIRINKKMNPGVEVLDVSSLEKGLYIIRLYQKESNRVIIDKLLRS
jgi:hypothetical protein